MNKAYQVSQILNEIETISESYKRVAESTGENFNIFSILQMESDEVSTHSRFIAELLNRKGSHGLSDKFLCNFIKLFATDSILKTSKSEVIVEYNVGKVQKERGGRIDILIKDDEGNVIMIENKIYAPEQFNQLLRYHNAFPNGKLIYLTLFGEESKQKNAVNLYKGISYETDMINWLENCKRDAINIPILRETISQYINLIKKLTHQNLNKKMNEDVISRILKDKNSLNAYKTLFDVHKDLKKELIKNIIQKIEVILKRKGYVDIETMDFNANRGRLIGFQNDALKKQNLTLALNFESANYSGLIIGFVNADSKQAKNPKLLELFTIQFPKAKQSDLWNSYIFYEEYRDWYFSTLGTIHFDNESAFFGDLEIKIDRMMAVFDHAYASI